MMPILPTTLTMTSLSCGEAIANALLSVAAGLVAEWMLMLAPSARLPVKATSQGNHTPATFPACTRFPLALSKLPTSVLLAGNY